MKVNVSKLARSFPLLSQRRPIHANGSAIRHAPSTERRRHVAICPFDLVNHTSFIKAQGIDDGRKLYRKKKFMEPMLTVEDRVRRSTIDTAETGDEWTRGMSPWVEPKSGNPDIDSTANTQDRGNRWILHMLESLSFARWMVLGAQVAATRKAFGVPGAPAKAQKFLAQLKGDGVMLHQFENPANPKAICETTEPEIRESTAGNIHLFISGANLDGFTTERRDE
jgi:cysteine synthase